MFKCLTILNLISSVNNSFTPVILLLNLFLLDQYLFRKNKGIKLYNSENFLLLPKATVTTFLFATVISLIILL